MTPITQAEVD
jgi:hypothetical protein